MGAWGTGPFDNDDAADFVGDLSELSQPEALQRVQQACRLPSGRIGYLRAAEAIAAASIVAAGADGEGDLLPESRALAERLGRAITDETVRDAHDALVRIGEGDSEWSELWVDVHAWAAARQSVRLIRARLAADERVSGRHADGQDTLF